MPSIEVGETYAAGLPKLGARLLVVAKQVRRGASVADIGCDHGKLAVYLVLTGKATHVVAVDSKPLPLARARALCIQTGTTGLVDCRLGDGLHALVPNEAQDIVIAGLSGETITEILEPITWLKNKEIRLVLSPTSRAPYLRRWLYANGFCLRDEVAAYENDKFSTVMTAEYTAEHKEDLPPLFYEVGLLPIAPDAAAIGYMQKCLRHLKKQMRAPLEDSQSAALQKLIEEVTMCLR